METLGAWLRQTREARDNTLDEVEDATRIRARFLEALEAGDFAIFPGGEVQVRGFLRIYARYLGLSSDEALSRYDAEVHDAEVVPPGTPVETQSTSPIRSITGPTPPQQRAVSASRLRRMSLGTPMVMGAAVVVLLAIVAGAAYIVHRGGDEKAVVTAAAPAEVGRWPTITPSPTPPAVTVTPAAPGNPQGGVTLTLEATEHVWVRVTRDGQTTFSGMMAPGQIETWSGQGTIAVDTGNGAGLLVTVNGQPQGTMCGRAQVCTRAWGPTGEITAP